MKYVYRLSLVLTFLIFLSLIFSGCSEHCMTRQYLTYYEPVYMSMEKFRSAVDVTTPVPVSKAGKMFLRDNYLFISSPNKGIHIIDNQNPRNPINKAFIKLPGNHDLAVRGDILYADSYIDLVAINISDLTDIHEVNRLEGVFQNYNSWGYYGDPSQGIVVDYKMVSNLDNISTRCNNFDRFIAYKGGIALNSAEFDAARSSPEGIGGSMARFALAGDYLYTVDESQLFPIRVSDPSSMSVGEKQYINWGVETIFPRGNQLFIGTQSGMYIYDVSTPSQPALLSEFEHVTSCDPVIADGNYAFVTLRSGTECQGFTNQLEVIDITDIQHPESLFVYSMTNPHGLGKDGNLLFICDGEAGLRIFDATALDKIDENQLAHYDNIHAYDVIPFNNVAILIGDDGLYQYNYANLKQLQYLSMIHFDK